MFEVVDINADQDVLTRCFDALFLFWYLPSLWLVIVESAKIVYANFIKYKLLIQGISRENETILMSLKHSVFSLIKYLTFDIFYDIRIDNVAIKPEILFTCKFWIVNQLSFFVFIVCLGEKLVNWHG